MTTQGSQPPASPGPKDELTSPGRPGTDPDTTTPDETSADRSAGVTSEGKSTAGADPGTTMTKETAEADSAGGEQLMPQEAVMDFKARWEAIQQGFVDDPRSAVTDADGLVGDVLQKLSTTFDEQHQELEARWTGGEPDTEDLRSALQRYRDFFDRLLTI